MTGPADECLLPWEDPAAAHEKKEMEDNEGPIAASREAALTGGRGHGVIKRTQFGGLCSNCERR